MSGDDLKKGDPVTVVLKCLPMFFSGSRLVHTSVGFLFRTTDEFMARDDDRPYHRIADLGATWLRGHVPLDGPEAAGLLRQAEAADEARARGGG